MLQGEVHVQVTTLRIGQKWIANHQLTVGKTDGINLAAVKRLVRREAARIRIRRRRILRPHKATAQEEKKNRHRQRPQAALRHRFHLLSC
jgi:hypothetical protein